MAQIITYPKLSTLANNDLLLVSDVSSVNKTTNSLEVDTLAQHIIVTNNVITGGGTIRQIPMFTPTGVIIGDSIMRQSSGGGEIQLGGSLDVTANVNIDQDLDVSGNANIQSLSAGYLPFSNYSGGDLEDSQLQQSPQLGNGLYQMKFRNADRFIIDKPSSVTSGDPEYLIQQDGNYKVSFGWDDDGAGFGYIYNWAGGGLRLGAAGQNPQFELDTVTPKIISHTDHEFEGAILDVNGLPGTAGQLLSSTVTGVEWVSDGGGTVKGTGTTNYVAKWNNADTITDSIIYDNGTNVYVGGTTTTNFQGWNRQIASITPTTTGAALTVKNVFVEWDVATTGTKFYITGYELSSGTPVIAMTIDKFGNVGIGQTSPNAKLDIDGGITTAADASIGANSITNTPGWASIAAGDGNTVLDIASSAFGINNTSNAVAAFVGGGGSQVNGIVSIAYGNNVQANGSNSAAFGNNTTASGDYSFAVGEITTAGGQNSMALGGDALAQNSLAGPGVTVNTADYAGFQNLLLANYASLNYASDAAAAAGGVPLGGIYHDAGKVKIRLV
jgi:hypothetical protein